MESAKNKIKTAVSEYKRLFPDEYKEFKKSHAVTLHNQIDDMGTTGNKDSALERHLYDVPEKLHNAIYRMLTGEEYEWYCGRGEFAGSLKAAEWFIKQFPEFKITKQF